MEKHLEGSDVFIVEVKVGSANDIRVQVDNPEGISIGSCASISRYLNEALDREVEDFALQVSSPGLSSPFRVKQQYEKNVGRRVEIVLNEGEKLEGVLENVDAESILLKMKGKEEELPFDEIKKAKILLSFN